MDRGRNFVCQQCVIRGLESSRRKVFTKTERRWRCLAKTITGFFKRFGKSLENSKHFAYVEISCLTSIKGLTFIITYLSDTLCAVNGLFSSPYSKVWTTWLASVLSSSIQFPIDILNIFLTLVWLPCCKLWQLVFFPFQFMALVLCTQGINWSGKNAVCNLQYGPHTRLVRGIWFSKNKLNKNTTDNPIFHNIFIALNITFKAEEAPNKYLILRYWSPEITI